MSLHIQESLLPTSRLVQVLISYSRFCKCTTSQGQGRICIFCSSVYLQQWAQALAQDQSTFIIFASLNSLANHASSLRSGTVPQGVACYREKNMGLVHANSKSSYTTVSGCMISLVSTSPTVSGNNDTVKTKRDIENNVLANLAASQPGSKCSFDLPSQMHLCDPVGQWQEQWGCTAEVPLPI